VDDVSLSVRRGEIFGVLGANGSGKSTLIRLIATLLYPDGGKISVFDHDVMEEPAAVQRLLNRVSVEASLFKKLSPMENLIYAARLYSVDTRFARKEITRILQQLGIPEKRISQPVEKMSRGMQQKVSIARALLTEPVLLLLDEPTTGLDPQSRRALWDLVTRFRSSGRTIVLTTHYMDEAEKLCDRIAIVDHGKVIAQGKTDELINSVDLSHLPPPGPRRTSATLEDVFVSLTGRTLRDE